jgi:hypothetical protein
MAKLSSRYIPSIYEDFKDLSGAEPRELARFYENNHSDIQNLETGEFFDLQVTYLTALFDLGAFQKLLDVVDEPIELSIMHNIKQHNGKDVFRKLLFMKADALYHTMRFAEAENIFHQLLRMKQSNEFYKEGLSKTMRKMIPHFVKNCRAISILFLILSAIVIAVEMLAIQHFFADYAFYTEVGRNCLFALGWITLIGAELVHFFQVKRRVNNIASAKK